MPASRPRTRTKTSSLLDRLPWLRKRIDRSEHSVATALTVVSTMGAVLLLLMASDQARFLFPYLLGFLTGNNIMQPGDQTVPQAIWTFGIEMFPAFLFSLVAYHSWQWYMRTSPKDPDKDTKASA